MYAMQQSDGLRMLPEVARMYVCVCVCVCVSPKPPHVCPAPTHLPLPHTYSCTHTRACTYYHSLAELEEALGGKLADILFAAEPGSVRALQVTVCVCVCVLKRKQQNEARPDGATELLTDTYRYRASCSRVDPGSHTYPQKAWNPPCVCVCA